VLMESASPTRASRQRIRELKERGRIVEVRVVVR